MKRLEYDVNVIEKEGRKLHKEYEKVMRIEIPDKVSKGLQDEQEIYSELKVTNLVGSFVGGSFDVQRHAMTRQCNFP